MPSSYNCYKMIIKGLSLEIGTNTISKLLRNIRKKKMKEYNGMRITLKTKKVVTEDYSTISRTIFSS